MECIAIYGASGFGREVLPLVRDQYGTDSKIVLVDDGLANDSTILSFEGFLDLNFRVKKAILAISNSKIRERLANKCAGHGIGFVDVACANSLVLDNVEIGEGSLLCAFSHLTCNIRIGRQFHANIYAYVAHDCVIGDFVTFAPGAKCNGNVHIDDHAYIGSGAVLKQGTPDKPLRIGRGALIGMGAVVTKDVAPGETVAGNPARPMPAR